MGGRDARFNLGYSLNMLSGETSPDIYHNPQLARPGQASTLQQLSPRHTMLPSACGTATVRGVKSDVSCYDHDQQQPQQRSVGMGGLDCGGVNDMSPEDTYGTQLQTAKKSPPSNGKKTKGRVKIKMEYIENKLRRYTTFSKRKTGIMKKAYELSTLTGTQVMLLVASETGHVYTFATRKLQPMITSEAGKALIQTCLNSPDPPVGGGGGGGSDQRMSATGFEETELTYNISDEDSKDEAMSGADSSVDSSDGENDAIEQEFKLADIKPNITITSIPNQTTPIYTPTIGTTHIKQSKSPPPQLPTTTITRIPTSNQTTPTTSTSQQIISPGVLYQTPDGMMYATAPNGTAGGVILSLAPQGGSQVTTSSGMGGSQLIAIPLSMMTAAAAAAAQQQHNGLHNQQHDVGELDLSAKRK